jgi:diphthamide synthase (EF-2-diphthine--ammonia ligase)
MVEDFARLGVDPCGERGEYHTAVTNSPLFTTPIDVVHGERVLRSDCHALDLQLAKAGMKACSSITSDPRTC